MPKRKYTLHSAKYCNGVRTNSSIKDKLEVPVGSRTDAMKQYKKSKKVEEISESSQEAEQDSIYHCK